MMKLLLAVAIWLFPLLQPVSSAACNEDHCLNALINTPSSATAFCETYLAMSTARGSVPTFLSNCHSKTSRISSACSCFINAKETISTTTSSPAVAVPTVTDKVTVTETVTHANNGPATTVTLTKTTSASASSLRESTVIIFTTTTARMEATVTNKVTVTATVTATVANNNCVTAVVTSAKTLLGTTVITSVATVTTTVTTTNNPSVGETIDQNGCPAIQGTNDGQLFSYQCGVTFGPGSIVQGTTNGLNVQDCASQCFLNILGGDCLGATYTPPSPVYDQFGALQVGKCTLYEFPDGIVTAPGMALAIFSGP